MKIDIWTGDLIGRMHNHGVTSAQLAQKLGMNPKYISQVLNGKAKPKSAEKRFNTALDEIIAEMEGT